MDEESKEILKKTLALAEENNNILKGMRRSMRTARLFSYLYWIFIIGSAVGAFYLIQPYIESLQGTYGGGAQDLINQYKSLSE